MAGLEWSRIIGQEKAIELLRRAIDRDYIAPAYIFAGAAGIGRVLTAKCFCQDLLCIGLEADRRESSRKRFLVSNHPDFLRVEPTYQHQGRLYTAAEAKESGLKRKTAPQIRIEQVRDITRFLSRPPLESSRSVVVIEDAHTMTEAAANALLKTLEEPGRATLILIAPSTEALLPTLVSRSQRIPFSRLSESDLERILRENGRERVLEYPALLGLAQGSAGEAIAGLEILEGLPEDLPRSLDRFISQRLSKAIELAKSIAAALDTEAQLWYINFLQYEDWQKRQDRSTVEILERARRYLLSYVQPRLVWECTLLELAKR
ncbi:DNA polymerase III subunit delta' [Pannus brasiliensis CCIBt3594]|uniref:DNA polymerase III subunit delta n=1 Tax=Pannus brasiliensis CCIBt3594 TaxID=1427578 RepID=A0AAW9QNA6_9CHRO